MQGTVLSHRTAPIHFHFNAQSKGRSALPGLECAAGKACPHLPPVGGPRAEVLALAPKAPSLGLTREAPGGHVDHLCG